MIYQNFIFIQSNNFCKKSNESKFKLKKKAKILFLIVT